MADDLIRIRIESVSGASHLAWCEGFEFELPRALLEQIGLLDRIDAHGRLALPSTLPAIDRAEAERLRMLSAYTVKQPSSSRLPMSYHAVPPWMRSLVASAIGRWQRKRLHRWARFPRFPLDLSADLLADLAMPSHDRDNGGRTPVLLSHDLDSPEGLRNVVGWFLELEEEVGARSVNFIVPCAWPIDHGLVAEIRARGHEVGVHGYDHSNRTPFVSAEQRRQRLTAGSIALRRYGATGYRAPSLLRTQGLLRDLRHYYKYDSSIPTSGGLFPVPNNGCASARPFFVEGIAEIPLSMPRDGSLRFLGYSPRQVLDTWLSCAERISRSGGVIVLLTHCEERFSGHPSMRAAYRDFLQCLASSGSYEWSTPRAILARYLGARDHADYPSTST